MLWSLKNLPPFRVVGEANGVVEMSVDGRLDGVVGISECIWKKFKEKLAFTYIYLSLSLNIRVHDRKHRML